MYWLNKLLILSSSWLVTDTTLASSNVVTSYFASVTPSSICGSSALNGDTTNKNTKQKAIQNEI
ncbi:hypothetical protein AN960_09540 [Bacillus sp. FJAT-25509]|nr:hypothetical protein AN960_09540 [Bacillus sp. FJAT-25509]